MLYPLVAVPCKGVYGNHILGIVIPTCQKVTKLVLFGFFITFGICT